MKTELTAEEVCHCSLINSAFASLLSFFFCFIASSNEESTAPAETRYIKNQDGTHPAMDESEEEVWIRDEAVGRAQTLWRD